MNYANHNLKTDLQEWKKRIKHAPYAQFGHQLKYFIANLDKNKQIRGLVIEVCCKHPFSKKYLCKIKKETFLREMFLEFDSEIIQVAFCYQYLKYMIKEGNIHDFHYLMLYQGPKFDEKKTEIIEYFISPIINYLHDKLDKSNSTIFLLEKYKRRTEWFTKKLLYNQYIKAIKNYEQILEDDLRLFLFDQGIDYPFSTPLSATGRADIVGEIETEDPLIVEIKIFDRKKDYGKQRIKEGFTQIVKYANDYNKDVGYLVIFNMDKAELNLNFSETNNIFPPSVIFNNKVFYFIVINAASNASASKSGTIEQIEITEDELTKK